MAFNFAAMQNQILCIRCSNFVFYTIGATCAPCLMCGTVNPVPGMDQLLCQGCKRPQTYIRGFQWVKCCYCNTINYPGTSFQTPNLYVDPSQLVGDDDDNDDDDDDDENDYDDDNNDDADDVGSSSKHKPLEEWRGMSDSLRHSTASYPFKQRMGEFEAESPQDIFLMALTRQKYAFNPATLEELSEELQDGRVNQILLHGKQGSGKTKLAKVVRERAKWFSSLFEVVLFATVSEKDTKSIQDQIADGLDLNFWGVREYERVQKIKQKIEQKLHGNKDILVIFDDVAPDFDPEKIIGIPYHNRSCRFLLTARSKDVSPSMKFSVSLGYRKCISMRPLTEKDALALLQKRSKIEDDDESSSRVLSVAKEITKERKWWPREIKKIGSSLECKPLEEWEGLLHSVRHSTARYQIFLSFRGEDTREHFTSTLYTELRKNEFKTFMDNELENGDQISTRLVKAIEDSRLSIVVLSANYPNSSWCLDELVHILKCMRTKKQLVWPVFYKVEPKDLRYQIGPCEGVMTKLEKRFPDDKIAKWKEALHQVCSFSGQSYKTGNVQAEFIQRLVDDVKKKKNYLYIPNMEMD